MHRQGTPQGTHKAHRHGAFQAKGVTDGNGQLPYFDLTGIGHLHRLQPLGRQVHFNHGQVAIRVRADDSAFHYRPIVKGDTDFISALNHVIVGDNVSFAIPHKA